MQSLFMRRRFGAGILLGAALALAAPATAYAAKGGGGLSNSPTYYVNQSYADNAECTGPDFPTIQEAVNCAEQNGGG